MELREPPRTVTAGPDRAVRWLLAVNLALLLGVAGLLLWRPAGGAGSEAEAEQAREVASKLKAAGALDEAADLYEAYLAATDEPAENRARIAYSLGTTYLDRGRHEKALRWFYQAESLGGGGLSEELGPKIVHALERLGRHHAAQAALDARTGLDETAAVSHPAGDPVVARVGDDEFRRSDFERSLDDLPPELARGLADPAARQEYLKKYVADELLWRKAAKLEYDRDPEVRRRHEGMLKQLAVSRFVEREILDKIAADEADVRTFYEAHRERYRPPAQEGEAPAEPRPFEEVRPLVERDYRLFKTQTAYQEMVESELAAEEVELYPERLADAG